MRSRGLCSDITPARGPSASSQKPAQRTVGSCMAVCPREHGKALPTVLNLGFHFKGMRMYSHLLWLGDRRGAHWGEGRLWNPGALDSKPCSEADYLCDPMVTPNLPFFICRKDNKHWIPPPLGLSFPDTQR